MPSYLINKFSMETIQINTYDENDRKTFAFHTTASDNWSENWADPGQ